MIEDDLRKFILSKFKSIRKFAKMVNIPYPSIITMLGKKGGIAHAGVNNIIDICSVLNLNVDALANNIIEEKITHNLNDFEKQVLLATKAFNEVGKKEILKRINELTRLSEYMAHQKREVIKITPPKSNATIE